MSIIMKGVVIKGYALINGGIESVGGGGGAADPEGAPAEYTTINSLSYTSEPLNFAANEIKWFKLILAENSSIDVNTSGGTLADTEIAIYDNTGVMLAEDDDGGDGSTSRIASTYVAGTYWVAVGAYNSTFSTGWAATSTGSGMNGVVVSLTGSVATGPIPVPNNFNDTYTSGSLIALSSHTAESGHTYANVTSFVVDGGYMQIADANNYGYAEFSNGFAMTEPTTTTMMLKLGDPTEMTTPTSFYGRLDLNMGRWFFQLKMYENGTYYDETETLQTIPNNYLELYLRRDGSNAPRSHYSSFTSNSTIEVKVVDTGTSATLYLNGTPVVTSNEPTGTATSYYVEMNYDTGESYKSIKVDSMVITPYTP